MKRLLAGLLGAVLILVGILLLFLPGPGILLILAGVWILWRGLRRPRTAADNNGGRSTPHG
jgi:hypothetical protein